MYQLSGSGYGINTMSSNVVKDVEETCKVRPVSQQSDTLELAQQKVSGARALRMHPVTLTVCRVAFYTVKYTWNC